MNIYFLELRNLRKSAIIGALSVSGVIFALLAFFPSMQTESMKALTGAKLAGIDASILKAFGLSSMLDFSIITNYFGYAMQYVTLFVMLLITQQAAALYIKEESDGTIEFLCAKPVSRDDIFIQKLLAHLTIAVLMMTLYTAVTAAGYITAGGYGFTKAVKEAAVIFSANLFVSLVFSAIGIILSTLMKNSKGVSGITVGIVFGTFILGIMSLLIKSLDFLVWFSPMDWIKMQKLMNGGIAARELIIGIIVIILCMLAAFARYRKKDLLI